MYHEIREDIFGKQMYSCVTPKQFQEDMEAVSGNFSAISLHDLKSHADKKTRLPQNPIIITFDDGYRSFYEHAFPVLEKLGVKATVSLIGSQVGKTKYKGTNVDLMHRLSYEDAKRMFRSGLVDFQSHSYDMHDNREIECNGRVGCLIKDDESAEEYEEILSRDYRMVKDEIEGKIGCKVIAHFYPFGLRDRLSEYVLKKAGCEMTLVGHDCKCNKVKKPSDLYGLTRFNVTKSITDVDTWRILR